LGAREKEEEEEIHFFVINTWIPYKGDVVFLLE
jgi:hypothetical protein